MRVISWYKIGFLAFLLVITNADAKPNPSLSGGLSIIPGLGQVANGDSLEGLGWFVSTISLFAVKNPVANHFGMNLWFYNMYDAYRDAGAPGASKNTLLQNYAANFNPLNIIDPIGAPIVGVAALSNGSTKSLKGTPKSILPRFAYYTTVGLGEEALFRGFLFPASSGWFSSKWIGALFSSALFSAAHGQGGSAFVSRFAMGMLFCWQVNNHNYDLRKNIFAHTWFDFLLTRKGNRNDVGGSLQYKIDF